MAIELKSKAFKEGEMIPSKYTCDGVNISPPLEWSNLPSQTKTLAIIADDPDAPKKTFVHWVIFNIPGNLENIPEEMAPIPTLPNNAKQGKNDFNKIGYKGPCPPNGTHRYYFKIYALDSELELEPGISKNDLLDAMQGHTLDEGQLMGKYEKR
jgi:Raf kinase inhibitor-like YbhB/YbcL family protein